MANTAASADNMPKELGHSIASSAHEASLPREAQPNHAGFSSSSSPALLYQEHQPAANLAGSRTSPYVLSKLFVPKVFLPKVQHGRACKCPSRFMDDAWEGPAVDPGLSQQNGSQPGPGESPAHAKLASSKTKRLASCEPPQVLTGQAEAAAEDNLWDLLSLSGQNKDTASDGEDLCMVEPTSNDLCKVQAHMQRAPEAVAVAEKSGADSVRLQVNQPGGKGMLPAAECQSKAGLHVPSVPHLDAEAAPECLGIPDSSKHPSASHEPAQVPSSAMLGYGGGGQPSSKLPTPSQEQRLAAKEDAHVVRQTALNAATSEDMKAQDHLPAQTRDANQDGVVQKHPHHDAEDHLTAIFNAAKRANLTIRLRLEDSQIRIDAV